MRYCEKEYYSAILEVNKNNIKETWKIINDLLNKKRVRRLSYPTEFKSNGSTISDNKAIAEYFNNFFVNVGPTLAKNIPTCSNNFESFLSNRVDESIFLNPVTDEEILAIVQNSKSKLSKGYDDIDMCLI